MGPVLLRHIVEELNERLRGGIISKVHQPDGRHVVLRVFTRGREVRLVISTLPKLGRIHLTEERFENPPAPLRFCAFLRSRIINSMIEEVTQVSGERIVHIRLKKKEDEAISSFTLVCELTGKSGNVILLDEEGVVLDSLKYFPIEDSVRAVMPGLVLKPLPPLPSAPKAVKAEEPVTKEEKETWNEAADRYYSALVHEDDLDARRRELKGIIKGAEKKEKRKLANLNGDKEKAGKNLGLSRAGELLTVNFKILRKGMKEVELEDIYETPPARVKIPLDPALSPRENIDRLFRKVKKARKALSMLEKRMPEVEKEIEYIRGLAFELDCCAAAEDFKDLEEELKEAGYIKKKALKRDIFKEQPSGKEPIRKVKSKEGFQMLFGKSGPGNDLIIKKYAKDEDLWFHAKGVPGSHVLLKATGKKQRPPESAIEEAAGIAAFLSKNKSSAKAEVICTEARNVKKPKGARPGMVVVREYRTLVVKPCEPEIKGH